MRLGRMKRKPFIMETNVGLFDAGRPSPCFCATNFSKKHPPYVMVDNRGSPSCCGYVAAPKCFRGAWTEQQERWINDTRNISADNIVGRGKKETGSYGYGKPTLSLLLLKGSSWRMLHLHEIKILLLLSTAYRCSRQISMSRLQ